MCCCSSNNCWSVGTCVGNVMYILHVHIITNDVVLIKHFHRCMRDVRAAKLHSQCSLRMKRRQAFKLGEIDTIK